MLFIHQRAANLSENANGMHGDENFLNVCDPALEDVCFILEGGGGRGVQNPKFGRVVKASGFLRCKANFSGPWGGVPISVGKGKSGGLE